MSTKTTSTNQYDSTAMKTYNAFQPQLLSSMLQMSQNPLGSSYFQNQLAQQQANAHQINQRSQSNSLRNLRTGGGILSNSGGYTNALINRNTISGSALQANAFNSAMNTALQNRGSALSAMEAYQPLQTGQTTGTSGLGTWLPQAASAAASAFSPGFSAMMGGNSFRSGYQTQGSNSSWGNALLSSISGQNRQTAGYQMPQTQGDPNSYQLPYQQEYQWQANS